MAVAKRTCSYPDCARPHMAKGLCDTHYVQRKRGLPLTPIRPEGVPAEVRFHSLYDVDPQTGCWVWNGPRISTGYGWLRVGGVTHRAHRLAYQMHVGPIPDGLQIDHKCRNRLCVNPEHLHPVTNKENLENRGLSRNNTSGVRGVYWDSVNRKWCARVRHNRRYHWGGRFTSISDAEAAVVALRNELFTNNLEDRRGA